MLFFSEFNFFFFFWEQIQNDIILDVFSLGFGSSIIFLIADLKIVWLHHNLTFTVIDSNSSLVEI